jgi:hypothetical protein
MSQSVSDVPGDAWNIRDMASSLPRKLAAAAEPAYEIRDVKMAVTRNLETYFAYRDIDNTPLEYAFADY